MALIFWTSFPFFYDFPIVYPLKTLEIKNNKKREDIFKFAELLEKAYENQKNIGKPITLISKTFPLEKSSNYYFKFLNKKKKIITNNTQELSKSQINKVILKVKEVYHKISCLDIKLKYKERSKKYEFIKGPSQEISFKDTFDKNIFPWYLINLPGIPIKLAYNYYGQECSSNNSFNQLILNKPNISVNPNKISYCYCKTFNDEAFFIMCSNSENCKYNGWFHPECCEEARYMTREQLEKDDFVFTCKSCVKKKKAILTDMIVDDIQIVNSKIQIELPDVLLKNQFVEDQSGYSSKKIKSDVKNFKPIEQYFTTQIAPIEEEKLQGLNFISVNSSKTTNSLMTENLKKENDRIEIDLHLKES